LRGVFERFHAGLQKHSEREIEDSADDDGERANPHSQG
jgi:hypothetical protein